MLACTHALVMASVRKIKHVLEVRVFLDVEATKTASTIKLASTTNVKIHAPAKEFVDRTLSAQRRITNPAVTVQVDLSLILYLIKVVFEFHLIAKHRKIVQQITCVLLENVIFLAVTRAVVRSVKGVSTMFAQKFVTPTITAFLVRFVMKVESVLLAVIPMLIVHTLKSVYNRNANALKATSTHLKDASISMNVLKASVTSQQFVKICLDRSSAVVHRTQLEMHMVQVDAANHLNAVKMRIVLKTLRVKIRNVLIHARQKLVEISLCVQFMNISLNVIVHLVILVILSTHVLDVSELNVSAMTSVRKIEPVSWREISVQIHVTQSHVEKDRARLSTTIQFARVSMDMH